MKGKSKAISGLKAVNYFTDSDRHRILQEMMSSNCTKQAIWKKYTGEDKEHGQMLRWMRKLGYNTEFPTRRPNFIENNSVMAKMKNVIVSTGDSFENLQLKKRNLELESQLRDAEMKAIAFSTMIDIAEKEFNIPIRKKVNTKPLKK
jgi:translation elongation factor EF-G